MAKVTLSKARRKVGGFSVGVSGMLTVTKQTQEALAEYLNLSQPDLSKRIHGTVKWTLEEYFQVQEFFDEEFRHE